MTTRTRNRALTVDSGLSGYDEEIIVTENRTFGWKAKQFAKRKLPIFTWAPQYKKSFIIADMIAGITVWLTAIPQSMAYAGVAGLTPEYGLYSHFVGPFLYIFFGSVRQVTIGPTAIVELMTHQTCGDDFPECVILMGFYSGVVELLLGVLNLGVIISFISEPVTIGFTAGSVCTIASSQVKSLLGLSGKASGNNVLNIWEHIVEYIDTTKVGDSVLGLCCIIMLLLLQKLRDLKPPTNTRFPRLWHHTLRWLVLGRNALVIIIGVIVAYCWSSDPPFALTGEVQSGLPPVGFPQFELEDRRSNSTETMSFVKTLEFMGSGPVVVAVIAILQNVAISKVYGSGQTIDGTQEMIALGGTNIVGGFFSCLPTSGSFTRSAVNDASGVKSQFGGFFVGILILLTLAFLTPTFQYIPKASLAAVIVCAVIFMVEFDAIRVIWKASKIDFLCFLVTFLSSLFLGMEYGIAAGVGVSALIILLKSMRPSMAIHLLTDRATKVKYILLKPDQGFYFPSVDYVRDSVNKYARRYLNYPVIVVQCDKWTHWDYTAVNTMIGLSKALEKNGRTLILYRNCQSWVDAIETFGVKQPLCCPNTAQLQDSFNLLKSKYYGPNEISIPQSSENISQLMANPLTDGNNPISDNANVPN
ncbi:unnamed protein product [Allacma fusca]|uniref:SLC26A/SulP transporter domain-containing protein n=1 Tax=Allacma fusca TaxID=39272 RepID=A0A8J2K5X5_9HEXA|nr:unnamed protein product [Allacma fusca]